jgi:A/G-specific adenine glycosylase
LLPDVRLADYTQAIMDLGATVCTRARPRCGLCPVADDCQARAHDAVTAYPQPRTRRERPVRSTLMLLLHDADGRILLERRPPVGIWAGLWSLPEAPSLTAAAQRWIESAAWAGASPEVIAHDFTHFAS